jgi:hypothetical protein
VTADTTPVEPDELPTYRAGIDKLRRLFDATKNPLYAWQAVLSSAAFGQPIPDWCIPYLHTAAARVVDLADRVNPNGRGLGRTTGLGALYRADLDRLKPANAVAGLGWALGLVTGKSNAFARLASDQEHMRDAALVELHSIVPERVPDPRAVIGKRRNIGGSDAANPDNTRRAIANRTKKGFRLLRVQRPDPR